MMRHFLTALVRVYQWMLSPLLHFLGGGTWGCRFVPSCSAYAIEALQIHGSWKGGGLALRRICRCHPWGGTGLDPVPPRGDQARKR